MRIGLAGTGRIGAFHASTLAALDAVDRVVVTDALPQTAQRLATEHGYDYAPDLDSLLAQVDGLVIATSTDAHAATLRIFDNNFPFLRLRIALGAANRHNLL